MNRILLICVMALLCHAVSAQRTYTINADSTRFTGCDSNELIIENHTQDTLGFLFNTGNGRTIFKRGLQKINDSAYLVGADTLKMPSNAWIQGGNRFNTTGVLGTKDNNHLDIYTNDTARMRLTKTGNLLLGTTSDNLNRLQVKGSVSIDAIPAPLHGDRIPLMLTTGGTLDGQIGFIGHNMIMQTNNPNTFFQFRFGGPFDFSDAAPNRTLSFIGNGANNISVASSNNYIDLFNIQNIQTDASPIFLTSGGFSGMDGVVVQRNTRDTSMKDPLFTVKEFDTVVMRVLKNGNVGIGTALPVNKLDVNGNARVTGSSTFQGPTFLAGDLNYVNAGLFGYQNASAQVNFPGDGSVGISTGVSSGARRLTIDNTGNTGIGTNTPTAQLHTTGSVRFAGLTADSTKTRVLVSDASGNLFYRDAATLAANDIIRSSLAVNGPIKAKQLILSAHDWPDYVFDSAYQLLPLSHLEKYIQQHSHLPGIPSAAAVASVGSDVGETQTALLKKIEELTLYTIEQDKKLTDQEKKLTDQKDELDYLKKKMERLEQLINSKSESK